MKREPDDSAAQLVRYNAALSAIAEAKAVDEIMGIRDQADALRAAAKIAGNKQAEIDMAEIRFRAERRVGELMAAQKAVHGSAQGRRSDLGSKETQVATLDEAGIDKNLANRARKLAAIPKEEFDGIVSDWRGRVESEHERVTVNLLKAGARAEQGHHDNDFYPTPDSLVAEIVARWRPAAKTMWEPCAGDGRVAAALRNAGFAVIAGDIAQGNDFFACANAPDGAALCTNPPFDRVREFIDHAFAIGIREMCLVLPERLWACGAGREQFGRHRPSAWINLDWREDYLGKGGSPDRALAVAIWDSPCADSCSFDVWSRREATTEAFDPETGEVIDTPSASMADGPGTVPAQSPLDAGATIPSQLAETQRQGESEQRRDNGSQPIQDAVDSIASIDVDYLRHVVVVDMDGGPGSPVEPVALAVPAGLGRSTSLAGVEGEADRQPNSNGAVSPLGGSAGGEAGSRPASPALMQEGSEPAEAHNLGGAGSTPAPATSSEPEVHTSWLKSTVVPIRKPVTVAEPKADHNKPNPICKDPDECGVVGSWPPYTCERCLIAAGLKKAMA